jgi:hypothetical protein
MTIVQLDTGTSATLSQTFQVDGLPSDLDSGVPTVTLVRPDGTAGPASGTVSHVGSAGSGTYSFVVAAQANPIYFDVTWVGTIGGQPQTLGSRVEWIGQPLFTIAAMRALRVAGGQPFSSTAIPLFTAQQIMDARAATLDEFQQILGFSPVPRFHRETHDGDGSGYLPLGELEATNLLSVTINGQAQSVAGYMLRPEGELVATSNYVASGSFAAGRGNVVVEYVAGWPRVMGDGGNVAMLRTAMRLDPGINASASSVITPDGVSYSFDPAGQVTQAGTVRHFGIPAIDSWLNRWKPKYKPAA